MPQRNVVEKNGDVTNELDIFDGSLLWLAEVIDAPFWKVSGEAWMIMYTSSVCKSDSVRYSLQSNVYFRSIWMRNASELFVSFTSICWICSSTVSRPW